LLFHTLASLDHEVVERYNNSTSEGKIIHIYSHIEYFIAIVTSSVLFTPLLLTATKTLLVIRVGVFGSITLFLILNLSQYSLNKQKT
jgi:hypothetical protein